VSETITRAGPGWVIAGAGQMDPGGLPAGLRIHGICDCSTAGQCGYRIRPCAHQNDTRLTPEQNLALRNAVAEFRSPFSQSGEINPGLIRVAERVAGVKNLRFERDPDLGDRGPCCALRARMKCKVSSSQGLRRPKPSTSSSCKQSRAVAL